METPQNKRKIDEQKLNEYVAAIRSKTWTMESADLALAELNKWVAALSDPDHQNR